MIISCTPQFPVASVDWLPSWCYLLLPLECISYSLTMVKILLHHILSILQISIIIRDSPTQQDPLPQALSRSSQVCLPGQWPSSGRCEVWILCGFWNRKWLRWETRADLSYSFYLLLSIVFFLLILFFFSLRYLWLLFLGCMIKLWIILIRKTWSDLVISIYLELCLTPYTTFVKYDRSQHKR